MARVTIKKVKKGYKVSLFRRKLGSRQVVQDDLGTFKTKRKANRESSLAKQLIGLKKPRS